jgi:hypothetical protein
MSHSASHVNGHDRGPRGLRWAFHFRAGISGAREGSENFSSGDGVFKTRFQIEVIQRSCLVTAAREAPPTVTSSRRYCEGHVA